MRAKENQEPKNEKGEPHGQWICYFDNGNLWFMDHNINGVEHGYAVCHERDDGGNDYYAKEYYAR